MVRRHQQEGCLSLQEIPCWEHSIHRRMHINAYSLAQPTRLEMTMPTRCYFKLSIAKLSAIFNCQI